MEERLSDVMMNLNEKTCAEDAFWEGKWHGISHSTSRSIYLHNYEEIII